MKKPVVAQSVLRIQCAALLGLAVLVAGMTPCASAVGLGIRHNGGGLPDAIHVALYREGKLIRTGDLAYREGGIKLSGRGNVVGNAPGGGNLLWHDIPAGEYEVHFSAPGYQEMVKQVVVPEGTGPASLGIVSAELGPKILQPGGPADMMWDLLREVRKEVTDLRARVEQLEAELNQLKNKK